MSCSTRDRPRAAAFSDCMDGFFSSESVIPNPCSLAMISLSAGGMIPMRASKSKQEHQDDSCLEPWQVPSGPNVVVHGHARLVQVANIKDGVIDINAHFIHGERQNTDSLKMISIRVQSRPGKDISRQNQNEIGSPVPIQLHM
jgi:hypothetical protein